MDIAATAHVRFDRSRLPSSAVRVAKYLLSVSLRCNRHVDDTSNSGVPTSRSCCRLYWLRIDARLRFDEYRSKIKVPPSFDRGSIRRNPPVAARRDAFINSRYGRIVTVRRRSRAAYKTDHRCTRANDTIIRDTVTLDSSCRVYRFEKRESVSVTNVRGSRNC